MSQEKLIQRALQENNGILRLIPTWVPRSFCRPGMRIKLDPRDTYALGLERGGIDERWLASTTHAENGPNTPEDEGLSYVAVGEEKVLLRDIVAQEGEKVIGKTLWEKNTDPNFKEHHFMQPIPIANDSAEKYLEEWICYKCKTVSAKRLTVLPHQKAEIFDEAAYGFITIQGQGTINGLPIQTPTLIRFGECTCDEYFVCIHAANAGVTIENTGDEPLVMLKHFAGHPQK